ncbi:MAG: class I SAM-dependent methyltransferase [Betaproteobacteria bacterium]
MGRRENALRHVARDGHGVEIGPSHNPIAPKRDGFKVHVIDHATRAELRHKYATEPVALDNIEEVDFVWRGERYAELTGRPHFYDWVIASHVIEHSPDLIAFLEDCDSLLKDGGVLSLVVPDKRYCFDRFRPLTGLARIIDAHLAANKLHSQGSVAEYFMNVVSKGGRGAWDAGSAGEYRFYHTDKDAIEGMRLVREDKAYLDIHNWCFVPHSFRLAIEDLHTLGFTKLREVDFIPTQGFEFFMTLGRHGAGPRMSRLDMLRAIDREVGAADEGMVARLRGWLARLRR